MSGQDGPGPSGLGPKGSERESDPVNFGTGDFTTTATDLVIPGRGFNFAFTRYYHGTTSLWHEYQFPHYGWAAGNSLEPGETPPNYAGTSIGPLGVNWTHSYFSFIHVGGDPAAPDHGGDSAAHLIFNGRQHMFPLSGFIESPPGTIWLARNELDAILEYDTADQRFHYHLSSGFTYTYEKFEFKEETLSDSWWYRLTVISDKNGNQLTVGYKDLDPNAPDSIRIDQIIDTLGNVVEFHYGSSPYLITKIVDVSGNRQIEYQYRTAQQCLPCQTQHWTGGGSGTAVAPPEFEGTQIDPTEFDIVVPQEQSIVLERVYLPELITDPESGSVFEDLPTNHSENTARRSWLYTYTGVLAGDECDFILLKTITDPSGTLLLTNDYSNINAYSFFLDRPVVIGQATPSGTYAFQYESLVGGGGYTVTISNKRGHLIELEYDTTGNRRALSDGEEDFSSVLICLDTRAGGELIRRREYTGEEDPSNAFNIAPGSQTRSADPVYFETTYSWNSDWRLSESIDPTGGSVALEYGYSTLIANGGLADTEEEQAFKKLAVTKRTRSGPGGTPQIVEEWEYEASIAGCCGGSLSPTKYIDGNGNETHYAYNANGNVTDIYRGIPSSGGIGQALSHEEFEYNQWGQVTFHTHASRKTADGAFKTQIDMYVYGTSGASNGRVTRVVADVGPDLLDNTADGYELSTDYEYDAVGNVRKITGPDGDYKRLIWNQADQLVVESWYDHNDTLLAEQEHYYDINGNPVRTDVWNFESAKFDRTNWYITTLRQYDEENNLTFIAQELALDPDPQSDGPTLPTRDPVTGVYDIEQTIAHSEEWAVTRYVYDENKNVVAVLLPMSNAELGSTPLQPDNGYVMEYDERDLLYRRYQGTTNLGSPYTLDESSANTPLPLVYQADYDAKGRLTAATVKPPVPSGVTDPDPGTDPRTTLTSYDPFDRVLSVTDPMGNITGYLYDAAGNILEISVYGELIDIEGVTNNQLLSRTQTTYDDMNRPTDQMVAVFDPETLSGSPTSWQWSHTVYNPDSSVQSVTIPAGPSPKPAYASGSGDTSTTEYRYDTAGRVARVTDGTGNITEYTYDIPNHLTRVISTEKSQLASADQVFESRFYHDGLGRRTQVVQGAYGTGTPTGPQNTTVSAYDSRSNLITTVDPRGTVTEHLYDGLGRRFQTIVDPAGLSIVTTVEYDRSSRVIGLTDDNGHRTDYGYDSLGRETSRTYADGTVHTTRYDGAGNIAGTIDARGVLVASAYDLNDRLTQRDITRTAGSSVGGTLDENYKYDGLGRVIRANNDFARIKRHYDSRGLMLRETFNTDSAATFPATSERTVTSVYDLAGNMTLCTYPSGREVYRTYDTLNRVSDILDDDQTTQLASYAYYGPGRVERRTTGDGAGKVETLYTYTGFEGESPAPADHGFRHISRIEHKLVASPHTLLEGRSFTWDEAGSKTSHNDLRTAYTGRRERSFGYDDANRLIQTVTAFPGNTALNGTVGYALDGVHNRTEVTLSGAANAGASVGEYESFSDPGDPNDPDDDLFNAELNQYTLVPRLDGGSLDFQNVYDANGNLLVIAEYPRPADFSGNYVVDLTDLNQWVAAFTSNDMAADFNGDDILDLADQTGFVNAFSTSQGTFYNASFTYDERNQLVEFTAFEGTQKLKASTYRYDCFNRRVAALLDTDGNGGFDETTHFVYAGQAAWQLVEEYPSAVPTWSSVQGEEDHDTTVERSYAYGNYIDEVLTMRDHGSGEDFFYHQDDLFSVYAMTDEDGVVVERYEYGDYGQVSITAEDGTPRAASSYGNRHTFTGRLLCDELTLDDGGQVLEYRNRHNWTGTGSWLHRDPAGYIDSPNLYAFVRSAPLVELDPFGLAIVFIPGRKLADEATIRQREHLLTALRALCPSANIEEKGRDKDRITCSVPENPDPDDPCSDPPACRILKRLIDSNHTYRLHTGHREQPTFDGRDRDRPRIYWPAAPGGGRFKPWETLWHELLHGYHRDHGIWPYNNDYSLEEVLTITEMNELREWFNKCQSPAKPIDPRQPSDHDLVPDDYTTPWLDTPIPGYTPIDIP